MRSKVVGIAVAAMLAALTVPEGTRVTAQGALPSAAQERATAAILASTAPTRIKDIAVLQEVPPVPLVGYGLVIGLTKTGDKQQTLFAAQSLVNMLRRLGVTVPAEQVKVENIAAVLVTAELPPFVPAGGRLDVTASSIGDARSLQGGTLMATPMRGPDGSVFASAQGALTIGGFGGGRGATSVTVNHLTVGRVPDGALVVRANSEGLAASPTIRLTLRDPDFVTASRVRGSVNAELGDGAARAIDAATVEVRVPEALRSDIPALMARLDGLPVEVDAPARVVINERTGTVVVGAGVRLGPAAVAHGNLALRITTNYNVSQPSPLSSGGETVVTPDVHVDVNEGTNKLATLQQGVTLDEVVRALNELGASPRDIIAIMQALKAAGALRAEIVII
jgi:flagellar P-ring protein precursor FlgI